MFRLGLSVVIQTTFANGVNCFAIPGERKPQPPLLKSPFNRHSLIAYYEAMGKPVFAIDAANHFGVTEHNVYRMSFSLAKEGCLTRKKTSTKGEFYSWKYSYTYVRESRTATVDHVSVAHEYLTDNPGSPADKVGFYTSIGVCSAPIVLLRMFKNGIVRREMSGVKYKYWVIK